MPPSSSSHSYCSRCGAALEKLGCVRCLLAEADQLDPVGRRPLWEESSEIDNCLQIIDDFALLRSLGRGGMAEVFLARQLSTGRLVAIKLLGPQVDAARVDREAGALASLAHPNIVGILGRGEHQGCAYLAMDYIAGPNLAERMVSDPLSVQQAVVALRSTARALAYAHERGVLHRDLKPHNILLDARGEPHLTDFGLALLETHPTLTETQSILGTPSYAAPEQLDPDLGGISPLTDVYGLGATLYHLLTGNPPFRGETLRQTCHQVMNVDPIPLRRLNPAVPVDLEVVCLACLEKSAQARYGSALELADELDRWLERRPIHRRPAGPLERVYRWTQRHPSLAALSAVTLAITLLGVIGVFWQWTLTRAANHKLVTEISRARRELAEQHFRGGETPAGMRVLARHLREEPNDSLATHRLWAAVARRGWSMPSLAVQVPDLVAAGLIHPDEEQLLLLTAKTVTAPSFDLQIHNARSGLQSLALTSTGGRAGNWGFSPNGEAFATLFGKQLQLRNAKNWRLMPLNPTPAPTILDLVWHPSRPILYWGEGTQILSGISAEGPIGEDHPMPRFSAPTNITSFSLSLDGAILAMGDAQGVVRTWDTSSGEQTLEVRAGEAPIEAMAVMLSPPRLLATFAGVQPDQRSSRRRAERLTGLWEWPSGRMVARLTNTSLSSASLTTNWFTLASGSDVHLMETSHGQLVKKWTNAITPGFTTDGRFLGLVEQQTRFSWIATDTLNAVGEPIAYPWPLELPTFAPNSARALIPTSRGDATVWNSPRTNAVPERLGTNVGRFLVHPTEPWLMLAEGQNLRWHGIRAPEAISPAIGGTAMSLAVSPQGNRVAAGDHQGRVSLLDASSLRLAWQKTAGSNGIHQLSFNPTGTRLAGGTLHGMFYQWSSLDGSPTLVTMDLTLGAPATYGRHEIHAIRYHPHLPQVAVACGDGMVYLLKVGTTNVIHRLSHEDVPVFDLRFSPDGRQFAVASFRGYAQVYDTGSGRPLGSRLSHDSSVMSVDFSPDGTLLLTGSDDRQARVWSLATGRVSALAHGHRNTVFRALFSPDGKRFVTTAADGSARVWETATGLPLDEPLSHPSKSSSSLAWHGPHAIAVLAPGNPLLIYTLPHFSGATPAWFVTLAESLSGLDAGRGPAEELLRLKAELQARQTPNPWESLGQSLILP